MMRKTVTCLIVMAGIIFVVMFIGCIGEDGTTSTPPFIPTSTPSPTPTVTLTAIKTDYSLGETAIIGNVSFSVVDYEFEHPDVRHNWTEVYILSPLQEWENKNFLWVYVRAKNIGQMSCTIPRYNQRYFKCDVNFLYQNQTTECLYLSGDVGRDRYNPPVGRYYGDDSEEAFPKVAPKIIDEGWMLYLVSQDVDINQAKIQVYFPEAKETVTWTFY
jgi:hypothetical protein